MLNTLHRFHGHGSLRYVYRNGTAVRHGSLTLKYTQNPHRKQPRFAVVVSKKTLKSAVGRNRIRRRIYELLRQELLKIKPNHDIVVLVFASEIRTVDARQLEQQLKHLLSEAGLYN